MAANLATKQKHKVGWGFYLNNKNTVASQNSSGSESLYSEKTALTPLSTLTTAPYGAQTLVLSGFQGGGLLSKPRAAFHPIAHPATLRHPATRMCALHSNFYLAGWTQSTLTSWEPAKGRRPPIHHSTKKRHKLRLTCVFVMQKKVVI